MLGKRSWALKVVFYLGVPQLVCDVISDQQIDLAMSFGEHLVHHFDDLRSTLPWQMKVPTGSTPSGK